MGSKLISAGCSFTDHEYFRWAYREEKPKNHIFWDELLAKDLGLELVNNGKNGAGSDRHLYDIAQSVAKYGDDIEAIVVGWSIWDRFAYPYPAGTDQVCPPHIGVPQWPGHVYESFQNCQKHLPYELLKACLLSTFNAMFLVTKLADSIGAKLLIAQMLTPLNTHLSATKNTNMLEKNRIPYTQLQTIYQATEENATFKILEKDERLKGFPFMKRLGGTHIWDRTVPQYKKFIKTLEIGRPIDRLWTGAKPNEKSIDSHPNAKGQEYIYTKLKRYWNELYK